MQILALPSRVQNKIRSKGMWCHGSCDTTENLKIDNPIGEVKEYHKGKQYLANSFAWDQLAYIL